MFGFSLFGDDVEEDEQQHQQESAGDDESFASQIMGFFSKPEKKESEADTPRVGSSGPSLVFERAAQSPVAKTLSDMAQTISDIADETIRTLSPAPPQTKLSYRRKTVFATANTTETTAPVSERKYSLDDRPIRAFDNLGAKYGKTPKEAPLLTSFSQNRQSYKKREREVANIASQAKAALQNPKKQETYKVTDYSTGASQRKLSSIDENSTTAAMATTSQDQEELTIKYDSENYLEKLEVVEHNEEDLVVLGIDDLYQRFPSFDPRKTISDDEISFYNEDDEDDDEMSNLIDQLLELGFLTDEEKAKLQKVLVADENLQKSQYNHFIKRHKELYNERKQCVSNSDGSMCPLCFARFGWFLNTGDFCPVPACEMKVCNNCRVPTPTSWICALCHKEKDLKAQAGYWFQQPSKNKKRIKTGTDILKKSLDTTATNSRKDSPSLLDLSKKDSITRLDEQYQKDTLVESDGRLQEQLPTSTISEREEPFSGSSGTPGAARGATVTPSTVTPSSTVRQEPQAPTTSEANNPPLELPSNHDGRIVDNSLKAPHIREIRGQISLSADSGFINDYNPRDDALFELPSEDDDDNSTQFHRYLMARSVAPDELAPQTNTPPSTPVQAPRHAVLESIPPHMVEENTMSAGASSSNISCDSISPSPTMIKANTRDRLIGGELLIGLVYNENINTLDVHINEGRNLLGVDGAPPHCYIKTYLLPDRSKTAKRKTKTKKKTTNPVFNEIFQYKAPSLDFLASMTLWVTVWDSRQLGHNMFLGEVRIQLSSAKLDGALEAQWWPLQHMEDAHFRGSILLSLMYCPSPEDTKKKKRTSLKLKVIEARDLPHMDNGRTNPYAALFVIPKGDSKENKFKLQMKKNAINPKWNAEVNFTNLDSSLMEETGVEIQILHLGKVEKAKQCVLIGVVRLCYHKTPQIQCLDGRGIEVIHWKEALMQPGVWVEKWHNLRSWE